MEFAERNSSPKRLPSAIRFIFGQQRTLVPRSNSLGDIVYTSYTPQSWQSQPIYFAASRTLQTRRLMARGGSRLRSEHLLQLAAACVQRL